MVYFSFITAGYDQNDATRGGDWCLAGSRGRRVWAGVGAKYNFASISDVSATPAIRCGRTVPAQRRVLTASQSDKS